MIINIFGIKINRFLKLHSNTLSIDNESKKKLSYALISVKAILIFGLLTNE